MTEHRALVECVRRKFVVRLTDELSVVRLSQGSQVGLFQAKFKNRPRFKLVGLKNFSWPFGLFWPHLKSAGLKCVWPVGSFFGFFTLE